MTPAELRQICADALDGSANLRAFLMVVRAGEGTDDAKGWRRHYGGRLFDDFAAHPRVAIKAGRWTSTAAGAYQFLAKTWDECKAALDLPDFAPRSQDLAAVFLVRRRGALPDALAGRLDSAIAKCAREWASLPGSPYGQPTRTLAQAHATYLQAGGAFVDAPADASASGSADATAGASQPDPSGSAAPTDTASQPNPPQEANMPIPAIVAALLPTLTAAVPELVKIIKPDSQAAEKNAAIAGKVFEVAKAALDASTEQEVAERVSTDAQAASTVRQAVQDHWFDLTELGGGGVQQAREADAAARATGDIARSPSFWIALALLPLVYLLVLSLIGLIGAATWSDDVRAGLSGSLISAIVGGLVGYYYGQTTTRNRTSAAK